MHNRAWRFFLVIFGVSLAAKAGPLTVSSQVRDRLERPIRGASIEIERQPSAFEKARAQLEEKNSPPVSTAVSDEHGRFRVGVPEPGIWRLRIRAHGFVPWEKIEFLPVQEPVEIETVELAPETVLRARVVDAKGKPVPGARLQALSSKRDYESPRTSTRAWGRAIDIARSGPDGTVSIPKSDGEIIHLSAIADGYLDTWSKNLNDGSATLQLIRGCRRALRVVEPQDQPAAGVLVQAGPWSLGKTDAAGRVEITSPCKETLELHLLTADGRRIRDMLPAVREGESGEIRFELSPPAPKLTGRVLEKGSRKPLAGVLVWADDDPGSFTSTDEQGRYTAREPTRKDSPLMATADGIVFVRDDLVTRGSPRKVRDDGSFEGPTLTISPAASVHGTVVDAAGHPVEGAAIRINVRFAGFSTQSDGRGKFRLRFPAVEDSFEIVASHHDFLSTKLNLGEDSTHQDRELKIVLQRGQEASARILDDHDRPVAGAEGILFVPSYPYAEDESSPSRRTVSDAQGTLSFQALTPGRYSLLVRAAGMPPLLVPGLDVRETGANFGTLHLPPPGIVEGRVVDLQNRPIAGAWVLEDFRNDPDKAQGIGVRTGADGRFVLVIGRGSRLDLTITAAGYANGLLTVEAPTRSPATVTLKLSGLNPAHRLVVSLRSEGGDPVSEAALYLITEKMKHMPSLMDREMGAWPRFSEDGRYELQSEPGRMTLRILADGYLPQEVEFEVPEDGDAQNLEVVLQTGPAVIVGQVTGLDGGPIEDVSIMVGAKDQGQGKLLPHRSTDTKTDSNGRFRIDGLTEGVWLVLAETSGYPQISKELLLHAGENRLDLQLDRGLQVEGRVVDSTGRPVPGAWLGLSSASGIEGTGESDGSGHFLVRRLKPGLYKLQAHRHGYAPSDPFEVSLDGGLSVRGLEIPLHAGGILRGRILGLTANEFAAVKVSAAKPQEDSGKATVDARGEYQIRGLSPGEWTVSAEVAHRQVEVTVILPEGANEVIRDLEFHPGVTLSGQVLRQGEPVDAISVRVLDGPPTGSISNVLGNARGEFRLEGLDPGVYRLVISDGIQWTLLYSQQIELWNDRHLQIEVPANRVSIRVVTGSDAQPVPWAYVSLYRALAAEDKYPVNVASAGTDAQGNLILQNIPAGSYSVRVTKDGFEMATTTLQVEDGGEAEAQLVLETAGAKSICVPGAPR